MFSDMIPVGLLRGQESISLLRDWDRTGKEGNNRSLSFYIEICSSNINKAIFVIFNIMLAIWVSSLFFFILSCLLWLLVGCSHLASAGQLRKKQHRMQTGWDLFLWNWEGKVLFPSNQQSTWTDTLITNTWQGRLVLPRHFLISKVYKINSLSPPAGERLQVRVGVTPGVYSSRPPALPPALSFLHSVY